MKRRFFGKGACFFEKKRAPARQTPGVVAELVFKKKNIILLVQRIGQIEATWLLTPPAYPIYCFFPFFGKIDFSIKTMNFGLFCFKKREVRWLH